MANSPGAIVLLNVLLFIVYRSLNSSTKDACILLMIVNLNYPLAVVPDCIARNIMDVDYSKLGIG
jgi:hypothetical protein